MNAKNLNFKKKTIKGVLYVYEKIPLAEFSLKVVQY